MSIPLTGQSRPIQARSGFKLDYWMLQLGGWSAWFVSQASGEPIFASVPWSKAAALWGVVCLTGLGLTHALRAMARRQSWFALPHRALLVRAIASVIVLASMTYAVLVGASLVIHGNPVAPLAQAFYAKLTLAGQLRNQFIIVTYIMVTWVAIYFSFALQRQRHLSELRQSQLSEALQAAELRLLKSQLNPHFLFNALNSVRALIADEPARAQNAVTRLARMLRYTLASSEADLVTLAHELEMVDDYLALESLRLADRLDVMREIDPAARHVRIPVMLLQTLVENAIKHGIAPLKEGGRLLIEARVEDRELHLRVTNPCVSRPQASAASEGTGLKNASARLRLLFGPAASLSFDVADGRAVARARLPL